MKKAPNLYDENNETELSIVSVDEKLYKKLCDRAGADYGSNLLINSYKYNDNGIEKYVKPFKENVTEISVIDSEAKKSKIDIGGILHEEDLTEKGFFEMVPSPVRIIVPNSDARYFDWFCLPDDEQDYADYAQKIMDEYFPVYTEDSYSEQGFSVRISRVDTMTKILNIAIVLGEMFPVMYFIPWKEIILTILALFLFMMLITYLELCTMKNQSLIEEIRMDTM